MNRYNKTPKVAAAPPLVCKRLLDQVRERIRYLHYSLTTEKAYVCWARFFILWSAQQGGMRHPRDMGGSDVEAFLTMLANERQVSPATHRQALNALMFLYRDVLCVELPWMNQIGRSARVQAHSGGVERTNKPHQAVTIQPSSGSAFSGSP